ncbi:unnamed protein product [Rotaria sp. Silwood1]|nr:unnamed protein product [Rotaria sp. Silwood1]CAF0946574.1 unnamed protein product [Rotaria sp. Silwood1]
MASSSSSNKTPMINKHKNNYFFYGTHPLKVPNTLVHANSTTSLSTSSTGGQNLNHLSLDIPNSNHNNFRHGYSSTTDLTTTKSLHNLAESRKDDDDNNEVIQQKKKKQKKKN